MCSDAHFATCSGELLSTCFLRCLPVRGQVLFIPPFLCKDTASVITNHVQGFYHISGAIQISFLYKLNAPYMQYCSAMPESRSTSYKIFRHNAMLLLYFLHFTYLICMSHLFSRAVYNFVFQYTCAVSTAMTRITQLCACAPATRKISVYFPCVSRRADPRS